MFEHLLHAKAIKIRDEVRDFVKSVPKEMINDMDQEKIRFPKEFLQEAGKRNLLGCRYPKKWGGRDLDWVSTSTVMEEVGVLGYIMACTFGVGAELVCDAIIQHGTDFQKEKYVKPLLNGELFAAECLTEPRGGSDFFGTTSVAEEKDGYFVLNGSKRFIVGGEGADFFLVYAKTDPDAKPHKSLSCFIVDRTEGVNVEYLYGLMGCRGGGTARISFKDVKVPNENVVGEKNNVLPVFNTMMVPERLGTAAMTIGAARPALEIATRYTTRRKAFGQAIANFQGVNFQIADAALKLDAARSFIYTASSAIDSNVDQNKARRYVSEAKKFVTQACQDVVHNSMQVMGGIGYTNIYPIEKIYRDIRLSTIWTGTSEVMSMIVAHEWYKELLAELKSGVIRDCELDCAEAHAHEEKIYE